MRSILYYFLIFLIYSILGWIMESCYVSIRQKKFVDRGFLIGPYCPIYGLGSTIMILYLEQYKDNILTVFILGTVICSTLEYLTSYFMEKLFKASWWDYSKKKFNLNGRICGRNSILFGLGGVLIIYVIQPIVDPFIKKVEGSWLIFVAILFIICFIADTIVSCNIVNKLKKNLSNIEIKKDSTQELKNLVTEVINNNLKTKQLNIFQKRIITAFPNFDFHKFVKINDRKIEKLKKIFRKN